MADFAANPIPTPEPIQYSRDPGTTAWGIILLSFSALCILVILSGAGVYNFIFHSTVPLITNLTVARGTVLARDDTSATTSINEMWELNGSQHLWTYSQMQGTLTVRDVRDDAFIVAVTIKRDTNVYMSSASRPRFDLSSDAYEIVIQEFSGSLDVYIPEGLTRSINVNIYTNSGTWVQITQAGSYTLNENVGQIQVDTFNGMAVVVSPDQQWRGILTGQRGMFNTGTNTFSIGPTPRDLIENNSFQQINTARPWQDETAELRDLPLVWRCVDLPNDAPKGYYGLAAVDGRTSMHLFRGDGALSHGETYCGQFFAPPEDASGIDVSSYDILTLRSVFRIDNQSLRVCGNDGSECPLIISIEFVDVNGEEQIWYHGFYIQDPTQRVPANFPLRCASCAQEHDAINRGAWYTYESENLFSLIPANTRPRAIRSVRFYASGHEYNTYVSQFSLFAEQLPVEATVTTP